MVLIVKISQALAYEVWGRMCMLPDTLRTLETCYHIIKMQKASQVSIQIIF